MMLEENELFRYGLVANQRHERSSKFYKNQYW